jgi:hypothetical protein
MSDVTINHPVNPAAEGVETWDSFSMQSEFRASGFGDGLVFVTRRRDGVKGTLEFNGTPRVYHTFKAK